MIKYLYIDDEDLKGRIESVAKAFSKKDELQVIPINPIVWEKQLPILVQLFSKHAPNINNLTKSEESTRQINYIKKHIATSATLSFDGIIFDLRLDLNINNNQPIAYRGISLAQELRTLATEGAIKDIPMVLFSDSEKLKKSYQYDDTGHDIFDLKYRKDYPNRKNYPIIRQEFISLAKGYQTLQKTRDITTILGIKKIDLLDFRVIDHIETELQPDKVPIHEYARFVLKELILITGLLIDKDILAARLGIDIKNTPEEEWNKLTNHLKTANYKGIFYDVYCRWWMIEIEKWWNQNIEQEHDLEDLNAKERVALLNNKLGLKLIVASKTPKSRSTSFWTVCKATKQPIAIDDSILLKERNYKRLPWQEDSYMSIDEALDIDDSTIIHPLERTRFEKLKKIHKHARN